MRKFETNGESKSPSRPHRRLRGAVFTGAAAVGSISGAAAIPPQPAAAVTHHNHETGSAKEHYGAKVVPFLSFDIDLNSKNSKVGNLIYTTYEAIPNTINTPPGTWLYSVPGGKGKDAEATKLPNDVSLNGYNAIPAVIDGQLWAGYTIKNSKNPHVYYWYDVTAARAAHPKADDPFHDGGIGNDGGYFGTDSSKAYTQTVTVDLKDSVLVWADDDQPGLQPLATTYAYTIITGQKLKPSDF